MRQFWVKSFTICSEGGQHPAKKSSKVQLSRFGSSMWQQPNLVHAVFLGEKLNNLLKGWSTPRGKKFKSTFFQFLGVPCDNNQILHMQKFCVKTHNLLRGWPTPRQKGSRAQFFEVLDFHVTRIKSWSRKNFEWKAQHFTQRVVNPSLKGARKQTSWNLGTPCDKNQILNKNQILYTQNFVTFAQEVVNQQFIRDTNGTTHYLSLKGKEIFLRDNWACGKGTKRDSPDNFESSVRLSVPVPF